MAGELQQADKAFILIVDDDPDIRYVLSQALEYEGYPTLTAANGIEALERLRQGGRTGLILLDLMMPMMNGWEFRAEQERDPELASIPVIIISGDGQIRKKQESLRVAGGLLKPVDLDVLLATVARHYQAQTPRPG